MAQGKLEKKTPFNQYKSLEKATVVWSNPTDTATYPSEKFDVVYDNNGKDLDACKPAIDHFKVALSNHVFPGGELCSSVTSMQPKRGSDQDLGSA